MVADPQNIVAMRFSPDGSQLAVATMGHVIQLWDLRDIRRQLQALSLDWDAYPMPGAPGPVLIVFTAPPVKLDSYTPETDGSEGLSLLFSTKAIWPASLIW